MSPGLDNPILQHIDQKMDELHPLARRAIFQGLPDLQANASPGPQVIPTETTQAAPAQMAAAPMAAAPAPAESASPAPAPIAAPARPARSITPEPPEQQKRIGEFTRLTAPPRPANDPLAHTAEDTGRSGIEQIHNPWARIPLQVLSGIGEGAFPRFAPFIPGTESHHNQLVRQAEGAVNQGEKTESEQTKRATEEASIPAIEARGPLEEAQTREADARVTALLHPEAKTAFEAWRKDNPTKPVEEWLKAEAANKPEHNETPFDVWRKQNPDKPAEDWLKIEAANKPEAHNEYADYKAGYLKTHPTATAEQIVKAYAKDHQAPERPPQTLVFGPPDESGNRTSQVIRGSGAVLPAGSQTVTGVNTENTTTSQMRNVAAQASLVHEQTPHMLSEIDRLKGKLGPMAGRWNEVMQGKIGLDDPDFAGLRADMLMYSSAVALMHARGRLPENLREEFDKTINNPGQNFANLKAVIGRIDAWTVKNMATMGGKPGVGGGGPVGGAGGNTVHYKDPKGNDYDIPADKEAAIIKAHPELKKAQ